MYLFQEEADEEIDATENEEDWIEIIKRSNKEAEEHMKKYKIPCWVEVHRRSKWRMARRIVSLPKKDGIKEFSTGTLDLIQLSVQKDQWADQKEGGKTISTSLQKQRKDMKKLNMI